MIEYAFADFSVVIVATVYGVFGIIESQFLGIQLFDETPEDEYFFYPAVGIICIAVIHFLSLRKREHFMLESCFLQSVKTKDQDKELTQIEIIDVNQYKGYAKEIAV